MTLNLKIVKGISWFLVILTIALSFPLQVYFSSPYPSLLPYFLIGVILLLSLRSSAKKKLPQKIVFRNKISLMVSVYVFLLLANTFGQILFRAINVYDGVSALVIYLLPVLFYWYFREAATEYEIRAVLLGIISASLVVGLYFAYDSYIKLALHQLSDYSLKANLYSTQRAGNGDFEDPNDSRIAIGYRSFGLLETHAVSGGWVVIGCVAALAFIKTYKKYIRLLLVLLYAVMLLLGLNFTSIVAFFCIMFLFEFGGFSLLRLRFSPQIFTNMFLLFVVLVILVAIPEMLVGDAMTEFIFNNITSQKDLALGGVGGQDTSMSTILIKNLGVYFSYFFNHPNAFFLGDGFSTYGIRKGGDIGFVESMARFGVPFFSAIVYGLVSLMRSAIKKIGQIQINHVKTKGETNEKRMLQFAISITILIFISEIHYTIWVAKSILPVIFFTLAIYDRYLVSSSRVNIKTSIA